jgi:tetratricopeptide (TPR) repeat protein
LVLVLIISAFFLAKKYRILSFCILFFFGNLFIESSFFGIELIYEHRLYLPSMFGIFAITCLLWNLLRSIPIKITAFLILACLLFIVTYQRNKVWADELTLWQDCVAKSPDKPRANYNLATVLYERKDYSEAIKFYNKTLRLDPNRFDALEGLGLAYLSEEKSKEALDYADKAIAMNPKSAHAYYVRGLALYRQNDLEQAIINFQKALAINPTLRKIHNDLAFVYYRQGKIEAAIAGWEKALQIEPGRPEALNNFAFCLATEPDERYRNPTRSCQLAERACEVVRYQQPDLLDTLSIAYASAGRFEKAVTTAETAIKLAEDKGNPELARQINERLLLYKNRQPYLVKRQTSTN